MAQHSGSKPTYYLWKTNEMSDEELEEQKQYLNSLGFRTVTFRDGNCKKDIHMGLKRIINNHTGN